MQTDVVSDVILWRRKQLNVIILAAATAAWTAMEVYQFNFITLLSWLAMALLLCLFFWGTIHRLLKKYIKSNTLTKKRHTKVVVF